MPGERPDYVYLKAVFRALRDELGDPDSGVQQPLSEHVGGQVAAAGGMR